MAVGNKIGRFVLVALKVVPFLIGLAGLTLVIAWIAGVFEEKISPDQMEVKVRKLQQGQPTDKVQAIRMAYFQEAVGTLKAANRSVISSKILATIQEIHVSAGDTVKQGDLLITLDTAELSARLKQANESLAASKAATLQAKANFRRTENLFKQEVISEREYDEALRQLRVSEANQRRDTQAVNEATALLSYSVIKAPRAGRIVDRSSEPGDTAQPGKPILTLYDSSTLRLETPVEEKLAIGLRPGSKLKVKVDATGKQYQAVVDEIVPQADAASRSFLVKATLPAAPSLYEGMYGRLQIPAGVRDHLCLNENSIIRIGQLEFVDVVKENGELERRLIQTGRQERPGRLEVLSGLTAGEETVVFPMSESDKEGGKK